MENLNTETAEGQPTMFDLFGSVSVQIDPLHCTAMMQTMLQQKNNGLCDFEIKTNKTVHFIHNCVLSAVCPDVSLNNISSINIEASPFAVKSLVHFAYTGKIHGVQVMSVNEISEICSAALRLGATPLLNYLTRERPDYSFSKVPKTETNTLLSSNIKTDSVIDNHHHEHMTDPNSPSLKMDCVSEDFISVDISAPTNAQNENPSHQVSHYG
ncbi:uncharacterized protein LOC144742690 [Ciona intestinalis]